MGNHNQNSDMGSLGSYRDVEYLSKSELQTALADSDECLELLHRLPPEDRDSLVETWLIQERRQILAELNRRDPGSDSFPHYKERNRAETIPELLTWGEFLSVAPTERKWTVEGLLADTGLSVLQGRGKAGKSTLALHLCAAVAAGKPFLGRATKEKPSVYVNFEMPPDYLQQLLRECGTPVNAYLLNWPEPVLQLETLATVIAKFGGNGGLLVIDSFRGAFKLTGKGENLAGEAGVLLRRLQELAIKTGWLIKVIHHGKRTAGEGTDSIAGTGDWIAAPDVIWSWSRPEATKPGTLIVERRLPPSEPLSVRLSLDECSYLGSVKETQKETEEQVICNVLTDEGQTSEAIAEATGLPAATVRKRLESLHEGGQVYRKGKGKRNDPYLWSRINSAQNVSYSAETNSDAWEDVTSVAS